jgi:hypothetical protein
MGTLNDEYSTMSFTKNILLFFIIIGSHFVAKVSDTHGEFMGNSYPMCVTNHCNALWEQEFMWNSYPMCVTNHCNALWEQEFMWNSYPMCVTSIAMYCGNRNLWGTHTPCVSHPLQCIVGTGIYGELIPHVRRVH